MVTLRGAGGWDERSPSSLGTLHTNHSEWTPNLGTYWAIKALFPRPLLAVSGYGSTHVHQASWLKKKDKGPGHQLSHPRSEPVPRLRIASHAIRPAYSPLLTPDPGSGSHCRPSAQLSPLDSAPPNPGLPWVICDPMWTLALHP